jgi:two-component system alkaline phosphatase synthesis response regulator PhoP
MDAGCLGNQVILYPFLIKLMLHTGMDNSNATILLADDEPDILEFLGYNLNLEGFRVLKANNGRMAVAIAREQKPSLIILDIMMPEMDGIEACAEIRRIPELNKTLVAFLTARGEDYSQIAGFEAGGDDYITKPIKPKLFIRRVNALLRRIKEVPDDSGIVFTKAFAIDRSRYVITKDGKDISFAPKEFELLELLVLRANKVTTREQIYADVWGEDVVVGNRTIDVHIRRIREKIENDSIKTIKGVGYIFVDS